jgi:hypothetical protein
VIECVVSGSVVWFVCVWRVGAAVGADDTGERGGCVVVRSMLCDRTQRPMLTVLLGVITQGALVRSVAVMHVQ